ncbi:hypothetical protein EK21DRAFT_90176 [Setomelanomma holmii]|uniref:Uncharacterized protein n=1 Tax=Setomelanomma holmii TaxID=210430 RepID=A0A9P4H858_9PLEO|nr:hypothetical protein EK21DRAFT_90176 [Setomelanomma holmii]
MMRLYSSLYEGHHSDSEFAQPYYRKRTSRRTALQRAPSPRSKFTLVVPLSQEHILQQFEGSFFATIIRKNGRTRIVFNSPDSNTGRNEVNSSIPGDEEERPLQAQVMAIHPANLEERPSKTTQNVLYSEEDADVLEKISTLLQATDGIMEY